MSFHIAIPNAAAKCAAAISVLIGVGVQAGPCLDCELLADQAARDARAAFAERVPPAAHEVLASREIVEIGADQQREPIPHLGDAREASRAADVAFVYLNLRDYWFGLRVPDQLSPPYWLADDIQLFLPFGGTESEITGYSYITYAFDGTSPYTITSRLYRFDACTSAPAPLVDWHTGDCCADPLAISGTEVTFTIPWDGPVEVSYALPAPVLVHKDIFMYLEYTGVNVAGNAGWLTGGGAEIGLTRDFWIEDIWNADPPSGPGCGSYDFGGDPLAGFAASVWSEPAGVMDMIPEDASGTHVIEGDEVFLDCHDLPQCVQLAVYARDWDPNDAGILINTWETQIGCESYETAPAGTLTIANTVCLPGACDLCATCVDNTREDFVFSGHHLGGC